jgi:hypothetical protein
VADFIDSFPRASELVDSGAQSNVDEVSVHNGSGATLYFDLYDQILAKNRA